MARIATLVQEAKKRDPNVLYVDAGDIEETNTPLSSLTKGVAMHRLMNAAGCDAAAVGNGGLLRYSQSILQAYAQAAGYPIFLANLVQAGGAAIPGVRPSGLLERGGCRLGFIGLTDPYNSYTTMFGLTSLELAPLVRRLAADLRAQGADLIVVLSHLGWQHRQPREYNDLALAQALQDDIDLMIGAHTHHLLPSGEQVGRVWVAQTGCYAEHLGQIELEGDQNGWRVVSCRVHAVKPDTPPLPEFVALQARLEHELEQEMSVPLCELPTGLAYHPTQPCAAGHTAAEALRHYWQAEVGLALSGVGFTRGFEAGPLTRGTLRREVTSAANPGVCLLSGQQLLEVLGRGQSAEYTEKDDLRGKRQRGWLHLSGLNPEHLEPQRLYRVAGTDGELDPDMHYLPEHWHTAVQYHPDVVLAEVLEKYFVDSAGADARPQGT